jgi:type IV secretion system protein VirB8
MNLAFLKHHLVALKKQKPTKAPALPPKRVPQTFVQAAEAFEKSRIDDLEKSRALAWRISIISTAITAFAVVGIVLSFLLHREPEATILRVDNATGNVEVLTSIRNPQKSYDDVVNRYWVANYVKICERYDWYSISVDYDMCTLMSSSDVGKQYSAKVKDKNAPLAVLKDTGKLDVKVVSISFLDENTASVRFTSQKLNAAGENNDNAPLQQWIATVVFEYDAALMTDQQRLVNPLGFKVLSYQINAETIGSR